MSSISPIVNVTITAQTQTISRAGFGTPMILSTEAGTKQAATAVSYASTDEMVTTGGGPFAAGDRVVAIASKIFAQTPRPAAVVVGQRLNTGIVTLQMTPTVKNSTAYSVTIDGEVFTFTSDATATATEIVTGLVGVINAGTKPVFASNVSDVLQIEGADSAGGTPTAGVLFSATDYSAALWSLVADITPDAGGILGVAQDILDVRTAVDGNDDWYCLLIDTHGKAEIEAAAQSASITGNDKLFLASSPDSAILDSGSTTDVAATLQTAAVEKVNVMYHPEAAGQHPEAAWAGIQLPKDPGSSTWEYQTLASVASYALTSAQKTNALAKNAATYTQVAGVNITQGSTDASGEYLDVVRFIAFLTARMQENVFAGIVNLDKVPYTRVGLGIVEAKVRETLLLGIRVGGLAADPAPVVTIPDIADIPSADKANRVLNNVTFTGTLAGAIHKVTITGTLSF